MENGSVKGMKCVSVYMTERELDALRHIKRKSFDDGATVSISGMIRQVAVDRLLHEKKVDPAVQGLLDGTYDETV